MILRGDWGGPGGYLSARLAARAPFPKSNDDKPLRFAVSLPNSRARPADSRPGPVSIPDPGRHASATPPRIHKPPAPTPAHPEAR
jgi:hypothetical protein